MRQPVLRPLDIPVALRMAEDADWTYARLHESLGISTSTAHDSVHRLGEAGLLLPDGKSVNRSALLEFLEHGIRYAFPAALEHRKVRGVATAYAAPALAGEIIGGGSAVVWPHPEGDVDGEAVSPLFEQAVELPARCRSVYEALTLVDALRMGRARERRIASDKLHDWLSLAT